MVGSIRKKTRTFAVRNLMLYIIGLMPLFCDDVSFSGKFIFSYARSLSVLNGEVWLITFMLYLYLSPLWAAFCIVFYYMIGSTGT